MSREILFKAKRKDNEKWLEGYIFKLKGKERYFIFTGEFDITGLFPNFIRHEIIPETICQYTGLTDKNGNKIWENDIVKCDTALLKGPVKYVSGMYVIDDINDGEQDFHEFWSKVEVIDNIFDNPELLKECNG